MDTNNQDFRELEQMRQQMLILKGKLDKQEIVNERLMRHSMRRKMSWINKYLWIAVGCIPLIAFCLYPLVSEMHVSWWFYGFTLLMVSADVAFDWYVNWMRGDTFIKGNLVETADKLVRMKRLRRLCMLVGMAVAFLWLLWLMAELYVQTAASARGTINHAMGIGYMVGAAVGAVFGGILGISVFRRMQRTNDDIISDIRELTEEK